MSSVFFGRLEALQMDCNLLPTCFVKEYEKGRVGDFGENVVGTLDIACLLF